VAAAAGQQAGGGQPNPAGATRHQGDRILTDTMHCYLFFTTENSETSKKTHLGEIKKEFIK
jgi:hypothetical protein